MFFFLVVMKSVYCCGIGCIVNLMRSLYWEFEYIFSLRFCLFENIAIFFCLIRWGCVRSSEKQGADVLYIGIWCINSVYMSIHFMWRGRMDVCASVNVVVWFDEVVCKVCGNKVHASFIVIWHILNVYTSVHFILR